MDTCVCLNVGGVTGVGEARGKKKCEARLGVTVPRTSRGGGVRGRAGDMATILRRVVLRRRQIRRARVNEPGASRCHVVFYGPYKRFSTSAAAGMLSIAPSTSTAMAEATEARVINAWIRSGVTAPCSRRMPETR